MTRTKKQPKPAIAAPVAPHVRWMIRRDTPEVLAIDELCFGWEAWPEEQLVKQLRQRNCIGMVAENPAGVVTGHMLYDLHKNRIHIVRFAVHPAHQRQGVGKAFADKIIGKLSYQRRNKIVIDIPQDNVNAQMWFHSQGFRAVEIDNERDVYRFEYAIDLRPYSEDEA